MNHPHTILGLRIFLLTLVALMASQSSMACGGLSATDKEALTLAMESNAYSYRDQLADAGEVSAAQNRAAYCGLRAVLLRQHLAVPDAGIACAQ